MSWPEAVFYSVGAISGATFFIVLFGVMATGRWPWDRR